MFFPLGKNLRLTIYATRNRMGKIKRVEMIKGPMSLMFFMIGGIFVLIAMNINNTAIVAEMAGMTGRYF